MGVSMGVSMGRTYWSAAIPGSVKNSGHDTKPDVLNSECSGLKDKNESRVFFSINNP